MRSARRKWKVITLITARAARAGIVTGVLLAMARIAGETAPLLFTALSNQFWSVNLTEPMANLPVTIFKFAMSPFQDWQQLAWAGVFLITLGVLALNILARVIFKEGRSIDEGRGGSRVSGAVATRRRGGADLRAQLQFLLRQVSRAEEHQPGHLQASRDGVHRSVGLRQVDAAARVQRMYALYPEQRAEGELRLDGKNILDADVDPIELRHRVGMVFQKPTPFPMSIYDNIAFGVSMHERLAAAQWTSASSGRCAKARCGKR